MLRADSVQICTSRWVKWAEKRGMVAGRVRTVEARVVRHSTQQNRRRKLAVQGPLRAFPSKRWKDDGIGGR